ncbi:glycosyltransferase family 2 protein [Aliterella atlantica]|uniref:Glycosyl transferase family A n=1 Tax=Aliterella atlantica CENA595 TaxID=1618023 RepID=A0A0D8ZWQ9_9CYAN|nr:glycosyltransferase family A protein [Aliterella atlantica]KJH72884.1 glycosyl transferase family A [Aliterella atlantica CENA595]
MTKISVIIPAYNAMAYLPTALASVLAQTFTDFEVLIINDGSSDNILQWAKSLVDRRVKIISQTNKGVSVARNTGISNAQGEYIAFLDADDSWEQTKLAKQVEFLDTHPAVGLVSTWVTLVNEKGDFLSEAKLRFKSKNIWQQMIEQCLISCGSVPMVRRDCFATVGLFDPNLQFGEDWEMWTRIAARYNFGLIEECLVSYRQHTKNVSKKSQEMTPDFHKLIEKMFVSLPAELLYLKKQSYGRSYLYIGWRALENKDYPGAKSYSHQALAYYPQLAFSKSCLRLLLLTAIKSRLDSKSYRKVSSFMQQLQNAMQ